jgi:hypothetical protein
MVPTLSALTKIYICRDLAHCKQSPQPFATLERTTGEVDPADLQAVSANPGEQSDDESLSNDSLFVPQTGGCRRHERYQHLSRFIARARICVKCCIWKMIGLSHCLYPTRPA